MPLDQQMLVFIFKDILVINGKNKMNVKKIDQYHKFHSNLLLMQYPDFDNIAPIKEVNASFLDGNVLLKIIIDDATQGLSKIKAKRSGLVDAWYLDGFSPAKNPDMWTDDVLGRVRALSAADARIATFTAAGRVRRSLTALGFDVQKRPGFDRKSDCVAARLAGESRSKKISTKPKAIAVIGAGIAGATLANALHVRGHKPTIIDAANCLGAGASGNPVALIAPRLTRERVPMGRIIASAYLHAVRFYDALQDMGGDPWIGARGSYVMAQNDDEAERHGRCGQHNRDRTRLREPCRCEAGPSPEIGLQ